MKLKIVIFHFVLLFQILLHAKMTPGKDLINDEPLTGQLADAEVISVKKAQ